MNISNGAAAGGAGVRGWNAMIDAFPRADNVSQVPPPVEVQPRPFFNPETEQNVVDAAGHMLDLLAEPVDMTTIIESMEPPYL